VKNQKMLQQLFILTIVIIIIIIIISDHKVITLKSSEGDKCKSKMLMLRRQ